MIAYEISLTIEWIGFVILQLLKVKPLFVLLVKMEFRVLMRLAYYRISFRKVIKKKANTYWGKLYTK